jgi:hypothetical protein
MGSHPWHQGPQKDKDQDVHQLTSLFCRPVRLSCSNFSSLKFLQEGSSSSALLTALLTEWRLAL